MKTKPSSALVEDGTERAILFFSAGKPLSRAVEQLGTETFVYGAVAGSDDFEMAIVFDERQEA